MKLIARSVGAAAENNRGSKSYHAGNKGYAPFTFIVPVGVDLQ